MDVLLVAGILISVAIILWDGPDGQASFIALHFFIVFICTGASRWTT